MPILGPESGGAGQVVILDTPEAVNPDWSSGEGVVTPTTIPADATAVIFAFWMEGF